MLSGSSTSKSIAFCVAVVLMVTGHTKTCCSRIDLGDVIKTYKTMECFRWLARRRVKGKDRGKSDSSVSFLPCVFEDLRAGGGGTRDLWREMILSRHALGMRRSRLVAGPGRS